MPKKLLSLFLLITCILSLAVNASSCGSGTLETPLAPDGDEHAASTVPSSEELWQLLEQSPGLPGIDYRENEILVVYASSAGKPGQGGQSPLLPGGAFSGFIPAADMPNEVLRENSEFEQWTDAISLRYGISVHQQVYVEDLNFASFRVPDKLDPARVLADIRQDFSGAVDHAVFNPLRHAHYTPNDPDYLKGPGGDLWSMWTVNASQAWDFSRGSASVKVAVIDSGVLITHEELMGSVLDPAVSFPQVKCDLVNNDNTVDDLLDHGTVVAGVIAATMDNSFAITGLAPLCKVIPIKIEDDDGATSADIAAGIILAKTLGARVVNLSYGGPDSVPIENNAVQMLHDSGIIFTSSAGNEGVASEEWPAAHATAIAVGSSNILDSRATHSNHGAYVDIAAPGVGISSTSNGSIARITDNNTGTSFASPLVAAGAALLWSYRPELSRDEVRNALLNTGPLVPGFNNGPVRLLDMGAAMEDVKVVVLPSITGCSITPESVFGSVPGKPNMNIGLQGASNISRAEYWLDLEPLFIEGPEDFSQTVLTGGASVWNLPLPATLKNQSGRLLVNYYSSSNDTGPELVIPVHVYNLLGDMDSNGVVDADDRTLHQFRLGLVTGQPGYLPWLDADQDGLISEADAAAVGYGWGSTN